MSKLAKVSVLTVLLVLIADQTIKIFIKTHYPIGYDYPVLSWFHISFIENNGMAFGMELFGKLFLSLFRIGAGIFLIYYLGKIIKRGMPAGYIVSISLILAGAIGNLIDSVFYGILFSDSMGQVAQFLPEGGGYSSLFFGKVVDMLYFPLFQGHYPSWMPFLGGKEFFFFHYIFNIADSAVTVGVGLILIFYRSCLSESREPVSGEKPESVK
jgi:signal peptidase II